MAKQRMSVLNYVIALDDETKHKKNKVSIKISLACVHVFVVIAY